MSTSQRKLRRSTRGARASVKRAVDDASAARFTGRNALPNEMVHEVLLFLAPLGCFKELPIDRLHREEILRDFSIFLQVCWQWREVGKARVSKECSRMELSSDRGLWDILLRLPFVGQHIW